jgi:hypothetical protein
MIGRLVGDDLRVNAKAIVTAGNAITISPRPKSLGRDRRSAVVAPGSILTLASPGKSMSNPRRASHQGSPASNWTGINAGSPGNFPSRTIQQDATHQRALGTALQAADFGVFWLRQPTSFGI